ncbi:uncharacterized protein LOC127129974 [Lathyrus oleraceus]|uniref:uncharacterized protein LOC127129974 n=1 Tax=Pisum sativum TaxID=3888 RepID=UPI0021D05218|nr:uncharacterized protein LOC127129974 [Pisum sativum]
MAGRNNVAIFAALSVVAQAVHNQPNAGGNDKEFLRKYFPEDVCGKKEIEFLELKQGNLSITEYAAKFMELAKFYPHYSKATAEFSKCMKFDNANKGKKRVVDGKRPSEGGALTPLKFYRCGELGHRVSECKSDVKKCCKCGKSGHLVADCKENVVSCYNYGEPGHISTHCPKPKQASSGGKVFALMGTQTSYDDRLIRGLSLILSFMSGEMVIETPVKVRFLTPGEDEEVYFLSTRELKELLEEETQVFALFVALSAKIQEVIDELQVVQNFQEVFPYDISRVEETIRRSSRDEICETKCVALGSSDVVGKEER